MNTTITVNDTEFYKEQAETPEGEALDHGLILIPKSSGVIDGNQWILSNVDGTRSLIKENLMVDVQDCRTVHSEKLPMLSTAMIMGSRTWHSDNYDGKVESVLMSGHGEVMPTASAKFVAVKQAMLDNIGMLTIEEVLAQVPQTEHEKFEFFRKQIVKVLPKLRKGEGNTVYECYAAYRLLKIIDLDVHRRNPDLKPVVQTLLMMVESFYAVVNKSVDKYLKDWNSDNPSTFMMATTHDPEDKDSAYVHLKYDEDMGKERFLRHTNPDRRKDCIGSTLITSDGNFEMDRNFLSTGERARKFKVGDKSPFAV